ERFIGSVRRECLDHVIIFTADGLERLLTRYIEYYERSRTHLALDKDAPITRMVSAIGRRQNFRHSAGRQPSSSRRMHRCVRRSPDQRRKANGQICPAGVRLQLDLQFTACLYRWLDRLVPPGPSTHAARELDRSIIQKRQVTLATDSGPKKFAPNNGYDQIGFDKILQLTPKPGWMGVVNAFCPSPPRSSSRALPTTVKHRSLCTKCTRTGSKPMRFAGVFLICGRYPKDLGTTAV